MVESVIMQKWKKITLPVLLLTIGLAAYFGFDAILKPHPTQTTAQVEPVPETPEQPKVEDTTLDAAVIFTLVNDYRATKGVAPLVRIPELDDSAKEKCLDIQATDNFSHSNSDGGTGLDIIAKHYSQSVQRGENLAYEASPTEQNVVVNWIASSGHEIVMSNSNYTYAGIAVCYDDENWTRPTDNKFIVQHFAN